MGQAPPGESYNTLGQGWPLIAGAGDFHGDLPSPKKYTTQPSRLTRSADIVLGIRASIGEKVLADGEYCLGRGVASIRPSHQVDRRYLWHWLTSNSQALAAKGRGATFKQVNRQDISEMVISLPRVEEQRRIAEVLDQADNLRAKRRETIALLGDLAESVFLDMFGDATTDWSVGKLGDNAEVQSGLQVTSKRKNNPI